MAINPLSRITRAIPLVRGVVEERDALREEVRRYSMGWPPGHFYSPLPSIEEVNRDEERIFAPPPSDLAGIDLNASAQLHLLEQLSPHYEILPFQPSPQKGHRYYYDNDYFSYGEAIILFCMIHHLRPRRIVEIGSGFSSAVMLDALDLLPEIECTLTFIEPYPERLEALMRPGDTRRAELVKARVQDVGLHTFESLRAGDILFVDSSHVSKIGSDVNCIVFELLPRLNPGVFVHFHDIYYPFEYPKQWICQGRAWNESYLLRAFLQFNAAFSIRFFNSYLGRFLLDHVARVLPLFGKNPGSSIWITRH